MDSMFLEREVDRICRSGVLGRSPVYARLLRYLMDTSRDGRLPKEIDIAVDVFERRSFESSSDSSVRVYLHNLRQKLDSYYTGPGAGQVRRICIPKGEYRLLVQDRRKAAPLRPGADRHGPSAIIRIAVATAMLACLCVGWLGTLWLTPADRYERAGETALWQSLSARDEPLVVVLGDYYMFGEVGRSGAINRLIRDFHVNSGDDLETWYGPVSSGSDYTDVRLTYLPLGIGPAMADVLSVIRSTGRDVIVTTASDLDVKTIRSSDIVYLGLLSGLGLLQDFVFTSSNFELGLTFDELISRREDQAYVSEAGFQGGEGADYLDYGFMSTFSGPSGNRVLVISGMRDEGLMQTASLLTSEESIGKLLDQTPGADPAPAMEAIYRVRGMDSTNLASELVFASILDEGGIWIEAQESASFEMTMDGADRVVE